MGKTLTPPKVKTAVLPAPASFNLFRQRLLLILICLMCYGNTVMNEYSLDDDFAVTKNEYIQKGLSGIPEILTKPYFSDETRQMDYRPVPGLTFAIEKELFGNNPHVSHLVNILLFVLLVLIIHLVLVEVFQLGTLHWFLAFLITLLYTVHPSHTEVVASIKNRDEILSLGFALLSLLFSYRFYSSADKRYAIAAVAILLMLLSLLSKIVAMPMLGIIFLAGFFHGLKNKSNRAFYIFYACLFIICFTCVVLITSNIKRPMYDLENPLVDNFDISLNIGTILETLLFYFKFMLWPFPPRFYYGYNVIPLIPFTHPAAIFSFLIHLTTLIGGVLFFKRKQVAGFFIIAYLLNIAFYCNLLRYPGIVSERILFVPSLWFLAAMVLLVFKAGKFETVKAAFNVTQKFLLVIVALVVITYAGLTVRRNFQWKNRLSLMEADIPYLKNSALGNYFYAGALIAERKNTQAPALRHQYLEKAKKYYRETLRVAPVYADAFYALGMIYEYDDQKRDSAFYFFSNAYRYDPVSNPKKFQLGKQYYLRGNDVEAEKLFNEVLQVLPQDTFSLYFQARVLYNMNKVDQAFEMNNRLQTVAPNSAFPYINLGVFYQQQGNMAASAYNFEKAVELGFRDQEIYNILLNYYMETNQSSKIEQLQRNYN